MDSMSEFMSAVSATRGGDACEAKSWPDAAAGAYGGFPAGPTKNGQIPGSEFGSAVSATDMYSPVASPSGPAPDGTFGFMRTDQDELSYSPGSEFMAAASATCAGDAQITKMYPDAQGGMYGSSSDGYKS